jgi:hypothetical protein
MGREDFSQSSQLSTLVGKPTNRYQRLPKNLNTLRNLTGVTTKLNNRYHYSIYPLVQREYQASYTQLTHLDFYSPIITIRGLSVVSHLIGTVYEDAGATVDEGSTLISTESTVDDTKFGSYTVTYTSSDGINPDTTVVRVVKVGLPPDVTINGANPYNLEKFDVFVDPGITINDSNSSLISTTSTVNNIVVGVYTVNYTVSNPAFTDVFSRTVRVNDTTPPVITISGDNPYTLERFGVYTDPGATVDVGSELINTDLSNVTNTVHGTSFDVVYTAYDGNTTVTATRTVNVVDTIPPVITILGDVPDSYTLERFDVYTDQGATVDFGSTLTTDISAVNNTLVHGSSFDVVYTAYDGNTTVQSTRTVNVVDTKPPVITLLGDNPYEIQPGIPFQDVDPSFEVDLGTSVTVDYSNVVTTDNSNFDVVYRASDGVHPDTVAIRRVAVADTLSPIITLEGISPITIERYSVYTDQGVTLDPGSSLVSTVSNVDNTTVGSYTITYVATDNINPDTIAKRIVNVVDTTAPIVTLNGASSVTLERYGVFADIDPGVTIDANGTLSSVDISQLDNTTQDTYTVTYNVVDDHNNANVITREVVVEDTLPPVVTLNNESTSYTLERYGDWSAIDPGVTIDRGSYVDSVTVDNTSTGLKVVTYIVKDGTNTTVKNRVITVIDTVAPVGSINNPSYHLERFGVFNDPGVTGLDAGTYLASADTSNVDNTLAPGSTFDVIYDLSDDTSNIILTRTVTVVDTNPPDIIVTGGDVTVERFSTYVDLGATVDVGSTLLTTNLSNVDTSLSPGSTFDIVYNAVDASGNESSNIRTVTIQDTVYPVIIINGGSSTTLERFGEYIDLGATVDVGSTLLTTNLSNVDTSLSPGSTFDIVYNAVDASGNESSNIRTVTIQDTVYPVIIINGGSSTTLERFGEYVDLGATVDAGSTLLTTNFSNVDTSLSPGSTFDIVYNAVDASGNESSNIRTVTIQDTVDPVIIINGGSSTTLERFGEYIDLGASLDAGSTLLTTNFSNVDSTLSHGSTFDIVYNAVDASGNESSNIRTVTIQDTIAPVASLKGPNSITIERYAVWEDVDPGINLDAGSYITSITGLNNTVVATYLVTYNLSDGVNSNTITRAVTVEDTTAPVITLVNGDEGTPDYTVERGTTYVDPGATADGGETVVVNTSGLNMSVSETYTVTYSATDADGNIGTASRTVIVEDTIAPVITLVNGDQGTTNYTVQRGTTYVDPGATADGGETVTVDTSELNMDVSETYTVTYSATDADGNIGTASRIIIVEDTIAPVITLVNGNVGTPDYTVQRGTTYVDPGATADGGETVTVDTSELNMDVSETYTVTYSATDVDGNIGTASRTVIVEDTIAPVITLADGDDGTPNYTVERGTTYVDPGATTDTGELVTINTSQLNMAVSGTYIVTYSATDADDNTGTASRTVIVEDNIAPVITLADGDDGTPNYTVEKGTTYVDPGATADTGETVTVNTSQLNMAVPETYTVTYSATDVDGNTGTAFRYVIVDDTTGPVITLSGDNPYAVVGRTTYVDPGATADGGETVTVNTSSVNMDAPGNYTVTYSATDAYGNIGTASRTVTVLFGWTEQQKIRGSDTTALDKFGVSVAISDDGNTAIAGAYDDSVLGSAYIFRRSGTTWTQQQKIQASDKEYFDEFGWSVAISGNGNTAIVGARYEDTGGTKAGAAYIFTWSGTTWSEQQKIQASDKQAYDVFGISVAISGDGNTVIVGADGEDTDGTDAGAAYIFTWSGTSWSEQQKIQASDKNLYDNFGIYVAISDNGNTAIVGAQGVSSSTGAAYIFTRSGTSWSEQQKIQASDKFISDYFGRSVAISGERRRHDEDTTSHDEDTMSHDEDTTSHDEDTTSHVCLTKCSVSCGTRSSEVFVWFIHGRYILHKILKIYKNFFYFFRSFSKKKAFKKIKFFYFRILEKS